MNKKSESTFQYKHTKGIRLSILFPVIIGIAITISLAIMFAFVMLALKDSLGNMEGEIQKLRGAISEVLAQTIIMDAKKNDFSTIKTLAKTLKENGHVLFVYIKDNKTGKNILDEGKEVDDNQLGENNIDEKNAYVIQQPLNDSRFVLMLGLKTSNGFDEYFKRLTTDVSQNLNIIFSLVVISIICGICISNMIATPLRKLSAAAKEIANGNFKAKTKETFYLEINDLVYSYNSMGKQLEDYYSSLETKVKERTAALQVANDKLKETQAMMVHSEKMRSLGELVAGIAHEINNPVNFIHGNIMILKQYADDLLKLIDLYDSSKDKFTKEEAEAIESLREQIDVDFLRTDINDLIKSCIEGTERTKNIILDLKNFSRMEEMVITQFDIPKEIDTTLNILNNKYKNRITVIKNYEPGVPSIEAYGGQLNQVFMNILDNAQDAIKGEGTLTINVMKKGENVEINFIDTGVGIPKENLEKVFEPFFTTKPVGKGTGLGMSISYRVIKDHQGTINVESEVGKGTKFTIILPINHSTEDDAYTIHDAQTKA